jgi:DNA repair exonuclease SbcCD ATPase subunit
MIKKISTKELDTPIREIKKILQFSDVHIRLDSRHQEYRTAFESLYSAARELPDDSIIVCCGDVLHQKINLSPESITLASELFVKLSEIKPLIIIPGNHDALISNKSRMDSLTPIIDNINSKNIYYLKDSGLYGFANILFNHFSALDPAEKYIRDKDISPSIKSKYSRIVGLYHGKVSGMTTALGHVIKDLKVTSDMFDGQDFSLLGDIHKSQDCFVYDKDAEMYKEFPIIHQVGSLIQQDFGETIDWHGYAIWDVKSRSYEHFDIKNEFSHVTLNIKNGDFVEDISSLPKTPKIRIFHSNTTPTQEMEAICKLKSACSPIDIISHRYENSISPEVNLVDSQSKIENLSDPEIQKTIIREFFKDWEDVGEDTLKEIISIHEDTFAKIGDYTVSKEVNWVPKKLKFSNMFSYGENNEIDYEKMNGVVGIFGKNTAGKSTTNYILSFCLFDKCPVTNSAADIMNWSSTDMSARFDFSVGGQDFFIEKTASKDKKGNCPVKINFEKIESDQKSVSMVGERRHSTNENIRKIVGSYDDFLLTTLSILGAKSKNLIEMGQAERKELLCRFTGLDLFDKLESTASDDANVMMNKVKMLDKSKIENEIAAYNTENDMRNSKAEELQKISDEMESKLSKLTSEIERLSSSMKKIDLSETDESTLLGQISSLDQRKSKILNDIETGKLRISKLEDGISKLEAEKNTHLNKKEEISKVSSELDVKDIKARKEKNESKKEEISCIDGKLEGLKSSVKNKIDKIKHLETHEYDPECEFCMKNEFVKDAVRAKSELEDDKLAATSLISRKKELIESLDQNVENDFEKYLSLKNEYSSILSKISELDNNISKLQKEISSEQSRTHSSSVGDIDLEMEKVKHKIARIKESEAVIEENKKIQIKVNSLKIDRQTLESEIRTHQREVRDNSVRISTIASLLELATKKIDDVKKIENKAFAYACYMKAVHKNGISYKLLSKILPKIQDEANRILSQIVNFKVSLSANDKDIDIHICYSDRSWKIELTSGMERFVSSIALRVALLNVSQIPKPHFIVIDEGFGALDPENLGVMPALFSYLKTQFRFVLIVSHLDSIKDYVDDIIDIEKSMDGFSYVKY